MAKLFYIRGGRSCILTGRRMTNLVLNFECFFLFFSADIKIRSERSPIHSKLFLIIPWMCPKFQNLTVIKKHNNNKNSKFDFKFIIWHDPDINCPLLFYMLKSRFIYFCSNFGHSVKGRKILKSNIAQFGTKGLKCVKSKTILALYSLNSS